MRSILLTIIISALSFTQVFAQSLPAHVLNRDDYVQSVARSPNGDKMAAVINSGDVAGVVILDMATKKRIQGTNIGENKVAWVGWANDEILLIGVYQPVTFKVRGAFGGGSRILSMDVNTGKAVPLLADKSRTNRNLLRVANFLHDEPNHIMMPVRSKTSLDLHRVNILTGDSKKVIEGTWRTFLWMTDHQGNPKLRFDATLHRGRFMIYAPNENGRWRKIRTVRVNQKNDEWDFRPIISTGNSNEFYVLHVPDENDSEEFSSIKTYNIKTNTYGETVYSHPEANISAGIIDNKNNRLIGASYVKDRMGVILEDKTIEAHINALHNYYGNEANIGFSQQSIDSTEFLLYVTGPQIPGEFAIYDMAARNVVTLFTDKKDIPVSSLGKMRIEEYTARDGQPLKAYITDPAGVSATTPAPLIIKVHGGPEARDYFDYDAEVQFLASRGYRVAQPYFRGSSGMGKSFASQGYGEWGGKMQDDVNDLTMHLHSQNLASPDSTCIMGGSYGGYVSFMAAVRDQNLYKCAASINGVSDLVEMAKYDLDAFKDSPKATEYTIKQMGHPKQDKERMIANSPVNLVSANTLPTLMIHGEDDKTVPYKHSEWFAQAMKKAGAPYSFYLLEHETHSAWYDWNSILYLYKLENFFAQHLGGQVGVQDPTYFEDPTNIARKRKMDKPKMGSPM